MRSRAATDLERQDAGTADVVQPLQIKKDPPITVGNRGRERFGEQWERLRPRDGLRPQ